MYSSSIKLIEIIQCVKCARNDNKYDTNSKSYHYLIVQPQLFTSV